MNKIFFIADIDTYRNGSASTFIGVWVLFASLICGPGLAGAGEPRFLEPVVRIVGNPVNTKVVGGKPTTAYPAIGALLKRQGGNFRFTCTGTLIGCSTFLTAAHCVCGKTNATGEQCNKFPPQEANFEVFFQHLGRFSVAKIRWPETYVRPNTVTGSTADVAILTLAKPVSGVRPRLINTMEALDDRGGEPGTIVGFGLDEGKDAGIKRYGALQTAPCKLGYAKDELVCWNYKLSDGSVNSCSGDSGGPLFQSVAGQDAVVTGVTSGGDNPACGAGDHAFDANIFSNRAWLAANLPEPNTDSVCGEGVALAPGGDEVNATRNSGESGVFTAAPSTDEFRFGFKIADAALLRVTLNAADPFNGDVDLYLVPGKNQDDQAKAVCTKTDKENFAVCDVDPRGGEDWTIIVRRKQGVGPFQITATIF